LFAKLKAILLDLQNSKTPHLLDYCLFNVKFGRSNNQHWIGREIKRVFIFKSNSANLSSTLPILKVNK